MNRLFLIDFLFAAKSNWKISYWKRWLTELRFMHIFSHVIKQVKSIILVSFVLVKHAFTYLAIICLSPKTTPSSSKKVLIYIQCWCAFGCLYSLLTLKKTEESKSIIFFAFFHVAIWVILQSTRVHQFDVQCLKPNLNQLKNWKFSPLAILFLDFLHCPSSSVDGIHRCLSG